MELKTVSGNKQCGITVIEEDEANGFKITSNRDIKQVYDLDLIDSDFHTKVLLQDKTIKLRFFNEYYPVI